jgi:hypothetical protein
MGITTCVSIRVNAPVRTEADSRTVSAVGYHFRGGLPDRDLLRFFGLSFKSHVFFFLFFFFFFLSFLGFAFLLLFCRSFSDPADDDDEPERLLTCSEHSLSVALDSGTHRSTESIPASDAGAGFPFVLSHLRATQALYRWTIYSGASVAGLRAVG